MRCNMMTKLLRCVSSKVRNFSYYDGLTDVDKFIDAFEREVPQKHHFQALDLALRTMLARSGVCIKIVLMNGASTEE